MKDKPKTAYSVDGDSDLISATASLELTRFRFRDLAPGQKLLRRVPNDFPKIVGRARKALSRKKKVLRKQSVIIYRLFFSPWCKMPRPYQERRNTYQKYEVIIPILMANSVRSLLDVGCNAGYITRFCGEQGMFSVGIDTCIDLPNHKPFANACLGEFELTSKLVQGIPRFDAILILSVIHQIVVSKGDQVARELVSALAAKAVKVFIAEFAALSGKYGFVAGERFIDNDEKSVSAYAMAWLGTTLPNWHIEYLGKASCTKGEPYRFVFACLPPKRDVTA